MKTRNFVFVVTLVVLSGWTGFWIGQQRLRLSWQNWKPAVVYSKEPLASNSAAKADFGQFWIVWDRLSQLYVDKSSLDPQKMVDGAISGMVSSLGDPYTVYLPPVQNKEAKEDLGGAFEGVGIQLGFKSGQLAVVSPLEEMPAIRAGVRSGDYILHIKDVKKNVDVDTSGMSLPQAVKLIRGDRGTHVVLTLAREGVAKTWTVDLVRETIVVKSVTLEFLDKVAWLKVTRFGDRTQGEWAEAVNKILTEKGLRGVVLDLRNNPGGYLEGSVWMAGEFLSAGKLVVSQQYGDGSKQNNEVVRNGSLLKTPLVVLINAGSASASEILTGALQDHRRAKVVGVQSFGKGSVQQPEDFNGGAGLHVTVAKWLRPSGDWIDKRGVTPDVIMEYEPDPEASDSADWKSDLQLKKAVEML